MGCDLNFMLKSTLKSLEVLLVKFLGNTDTVENLLKILLEYLSLCVWWVRPR